MAFAPTIACDGGSARHHGGTTPPGGAGGGGTSNRPRGAVVEIALGTDHGCARYRGGQLRCWGGNAFGQLGNGTTEPSPAAVDAVDFAVTTQVVAGDGFTCALDDAAGVWCFGRNDEGQLGDGNGGPGRAASTAAVAVRGLSDVTQLAAGRSHVCALRRAGTVVCWGSNRDGQLGIGPTPYGWTATPMAVTGLP